MRFTYPEGATPLGDISDLKCNWVVTQEDLNHVEVENISKAVSKYLLKNVKLPAEWFNVPFLLKIHYDMFSDVWSWAGKLRKTQTCPGIKPYQISSAMAHLCEDVQFWCSEESNEEPIWQAVKIHHRLVHIHPFPNGNGRFSRLIADRYLKSLKHNFPKWPSDIDRDGKSRKTYIMALREADKGNLNPLLHFVKDLI
jgi:Fic-DOC domain mobile mystery protein B